MKKQWLGLILLPAVFFGCSGEVEQTSAPPTPKNPIQDFIHPSITPVPKDAIPTIAPNASIDIEDLSEAIGKKGEISSIEIDFFTKYFPQCVQVIREYNKKNKNDSIAIAEALKESDWILQLKGFNKLMRRYIFPQMTSADIPDASDEIKEASDDGVLRAKLEKSDPEAYDKLMKLEKNFTESRTKKWADLQFFLFQNAVDGYSLYRISEKICDIHAQIPPIEPAEPPVDPEKIPKIFAAREKIKEFTKEKELVETAMKARKLSAEDIAILEKALNASKNKIAEQEKIIENNMPAPKKPNPPVNNPLKEYEVALKKALDEAVRPEYE